MGYLTDEQSALVSEAVRSAEAHTAGEIVTVLADRSDGYSDVSLFWAVVVSFTAMSAIAMFPAFYTGLIDQLLGGWNAGWTTGELLTLVIAVGLIKFLAMWAIQQWDPLRFLLIPGPIKTARVHDRAISLFKVGAERRTHGRTGIIIYLSMREHRAEIVADRSIAEKVDAEVWGAAMEDMLVEIKQGKIAEGMAVGVKDVGVVLAEHFPRHEDDVNELPDRLIEV